MRIPRSILIKNKLWKIRQKTNLTDDYGNLVYGLCCYESKTLWIERAVGKKLKSQILLHEVLHGCFFELKAKLSFKEDERITQGLEEILLKSFRITPR